MIMKISITGHKSGIGLSIYQKLSEDPNNQITGWDILDGWDIADDLVQKKIIEDLDNQDVFINNAYCYLAQTRLLEEAIRQWENKEKIIINIGAAMTQATNESIYRMEIVFQNQLLAYAADKDVQNSICKNRLGLSRPRIQNVLVDFAKTSLADSCDLNGGIPTDSIAEQIVNSMPQLNNPAYLSLLMISDSYGQRNIFEKNYARS